ncbi:MAG: DUF58 domain-containing protein [Verrucomicrobiales bacterium]
MLDQDLDAQISRLQIRSRRAVDEILAGEYLSVFKGRGVEFDEVREYQAGDDVRSIDWNVTARTGKPFIKRYVEERELSIHFVVDMSASGRFGSRDKTKAEAAAELTSLLAFSAVKNNDRVSLILFTEEVELYIPPGKGRSHVMRILSELVSFEPKHRGTRIESALEFLGQVTKKHAVVFLVSDFQASGYEEALSALARRHDLIGVVVGDAHERELPPVGMLRIRDAETGQVRIVDTGNPEIRGAFLESAREHRAELENLFAEAGIDHIDVLAGDDYVADLHEFFLARMKTPQYNHHA